MILMRCLFRPPEPPDLSYKLSVHGITLRMYRIRGTQRITQGKENEEGTEEEKEETKTKNHSLLNKRQRSCSVRNYFNPYTGTA